MEAYARQASNGTHADPVLMWFHGQEAYMINTPLAFASALNSLLWTAIEEDGPPVVQVFVVARPEDMGAVPTDQRGKSNRATSPLHN